MFLINQNAMALPIIHFYANNTEYKTQCETVETISYEYLTENHKNLILDSRNYSLNLEHRMMNSGNNLVNTKHLSKGSCHKQPEGEGGCTESPDTDPPLKKWKISENIPYI